MEVNDLMIGDWITSRKWREKPFQLTCINDNIKFYGKIEDICVGPFLIEELNPVLLTSEILEKNGFNDDGEGVYGDDNSYFVPIYQSERNASYFIPTCTCGHIEAWETHIEPTEGIGDFSGKLKYVHELQHALRLCGIEKEIIL